MRGRASGAAADGARREDSDSLQRLKAAPLDTRASQTLEPIRLPAKLRERIEKAQRRAAAAKDGVSIFTPSTEIQQLQSSEPAAIGALKLGGAPPAGAGRAASSILQAGSSPSQPPPPDLQPSSVAAALLREKIHLPDVVLAHKMRDFEAKTSANSLLLDPLDNSLGRLTLDEKERVMQRMQEKIQHITRDIDDNFVRIKDALDANGIFDAVANYQRAQAMCLVELQKRCKLEQLRDDAIREIVDGDESASAARDARRRRMSGKLSLLLAQSNQLGHDGADDDARHEPELRTRREAASRHATPLTGARSAKSAKKAATRSHGRLPKLASESPNQRQSEDSGTLTLARSSDSRGASSRRLGGAATSPASRGTVRDDGSGLGGGGGGGGGGGDRGDDALARHPHIAYVLQQMASGGRAASEANRSTLNAASNTSDADDARPQEQWAERSKAYQVIAQRTVDALRSRLERVRWDTLGLFTATAETAPAISDALLKRISVGIDAKRSKGASSSGADSSPEPSAREAIAEKRKRTDQLYASVQEQIRSRLQHEKKRPPIASAKSLRSRSSGPGAAGAGTVGAASASHPTSADHEPPSKSASSAQGGRRAASLAASASAPVLGSKSGVTDSTTAESAGTPTAAGPAPASQLSLSLSLSVPGLQEGSGPPIVRDKSDAGRNSMVERKLRASQPRVRRKESLIGAPVVTDFNTIGHHSNARMEERRYSAQTWMWHHPGSLQDARGPKPVAEASDEDDDEGEGGDTFGYDDEEDGDGADGEDEDALENDRDDSNDTDDASSVAYSFFDLGSARSSRSSASQLVRKKKVAKKRNGKLMHQASSNSLQHHHSHASGQTAGSMAMQTRLEEVWRALEFPFSHKLLMLEKYADLQDADVFQCAIASWERAAEVVLVRERMKAALKEFDEHEELKPASRLAGSEWMFLRSLQIDTPGESVLHVMPSQDLVRWIRDNMDAVTSRCHKFAHELKTTTGDDLHFQGCAYPPRL